MVITLTLSPCLDKTYVVDGLVPDRLNYASKSVLLPGSKGVNVSRMLTSLAVPSIAVGFCGGTLGYLFKTLLDMENVRYDFVETKTEIRFNVKIADRVKNIFTDVNERQENVSPQEFDRLIELYKKHIKSASFIVIAGSARTEMPKDVYNEFIRIANAEGKRVLLDTKGEELKYAIYEHPHLIAPNHYELSEYAGKELTTAEDIVPVLTEIHKSGVAYAIATMAEKGAVMVCKEGTYKMTPPTVTAINTTGAGDSFLAGIIYGMKNNADSVRMLKLAGSISSAKVTRSDTSMPNMIEALGLLDLVKVERLC